MSYLLLQFLLCFTHPIVNFWLVVDGRQWTIGCVVGETDADGDFLGGGGGQTQVDVVILKSHFNRTTCSQLLLSIDYEFCRATARGLYPRVQTRWLVKGQ